MLAMSFSQAFLPNELRGGILKEGNMQRSFIGLVVAITTIMTPFLAFAGNQEVADQMAAQIRQGLPKSDCIVVRYQNGTAYLTGQVAQQEQMKSALKVAYQTPGVTKVVNEIVVGGPATPQPVASQTPAMNSVAGQSDNPLRESQNKSVWQKMGLFGGTDAKSADSVEELPNSVSSNKVATVSAEEPVIEPPQQVAPQKARPMGTASKKAQYVARQQQQGEVQQNPNGGAPLPMYAAGANPSGVAPVRYDQPRMPNYAWPSYAAYPNYAAVTYPKQYSPTAWPYIGPFYPYPQVPMGWRRVTLEWSDGWWFLDFKDQPASAWQH
jgi:hypothetical protein